jgi:hypothetical protein
MLAYQRLLFARRLALVALLCASPAAVPVSDISLSVDDVEGPAFSMKAIGVTLKPDGAARIVIGRLKLMDREIGNATLICASLQMPASAIRCSQGKVEAGDFRSDLAFDYDISGKRLGLTLAPAADEHWQLDAGLVKDTWQAEFRVANGQCRRLAALLPKEQPRPSAGVLNGRLTLSGKGTLPARIDGSLRVADLAFSDAAGLRAADKLAGSITVRADRSGPGLRWQAQLSWDQGEVYWAPLYLPAGGQRLNASGQWTNGSLRVEDGILRVAGVGEARFTLDWRPGHVPATATVEADGLDANGLYKLFLKPLLEKTALDQLTVSGSAGTRLRYVAGQVEEVDLELIDLGLIDERKRFSVDKLNLSLPWRAQGEGSAVVRLASATLLSIPIGAFEAPIRTRGYSLAADELVIPVLDGKLLIRDLAAKRGDEDWRWKFSGVLLPISMESATKALKGPVMGGALAATIPEVTYENGRVNVEGGIGIRLFDGDVSITQLTLSEPLGRAPRLTADVEMRNLDLGLVTSTFKFGSIQGRIDADVKNLELSNWKPVKFDARVASSPGDYDKKISQQAVENISALGGAGAAAAIQRSFLRVFKEFGYQKLGLSCRLRNDVCEMAGVESTPQGYVIVKGGGIPAITVLGYNRQVGWNELLERLARIVEGNTQPIIK